MLRENLEENQGSRGCLGSSANHSAGTKMHQSFSPSNHEVSRINFSSGNLGLKNIEKKNKEINNITGMKRKKNSEEKINNGFSSSDCHTTRTRGEN